MKRRQFPSWWLVALFLLTALLVACERPLQDDVSPELGTLEPAATPAETEGETPPGATEGETPGVATPELLPTPTSAVPAATEEPAAEATEETATAEPAATEEPPAEEGTGEEQPAEDVVHTVVAGDTVGKIAERYGVTIEAIAQANNLANVNTLDVGQQLLIPLSGETPAEEEGAGEEEPAGEERIHVVRAGETLFRIGQAYGFTVEELVTYNNLANPDRLEVGQQIRIPPEGYSVEQ